MEEGLRRLCLLRLLFSVVMLETNREAKRVIWTYLPRPAAMLVLRLPLLLTHISPTPLKSKNTHKQLTIPTLSASSSSLLILAIATSLASFNCFAVGNPTIFAFSSASYRMRRSRGETWERTVAGFRCEVETRVCRAAVYFAGPFVGERWRVGRMVRIALDL